MSVFIPVEGLLNLEQSHKWNEAITLLHNYWLTDQSNSRVACRLIAECWYVLSNWDLYAKEDMSFDFIKNIMIYTTQYGLDHYKDVDFLWVVGYMMALFPFLFHNEQQETTDAFCQSKGKSLLKKASKIDPNNKIANLLYIGAQEDSFAEYKSRRSCLNEVVENAFPGATAVEQYFREIVSISTE